MAFDERDLFGDRSFGFAVDTDVPGARPIQGMQATPRVDWNRVAQDVTDSLVELSPLPDHQNVEPTPPAAEL